MDLGNKHLLSKYIRPDRMQLTRRHKMQDSQFAIFLPRLQFRITLQSRNTTPDNVIYNESIHILFRYCHSLWFDFAHNTR